jgi:exopolyphosphatase / guanosine-5'-triphosphate,3'-diphosphate pyrophosphatase
MSIRAAIDVGSNSVKLLVLEIDSAGGYRILHDEARVTGLGKGVGERGALNPASIAETLAILRDYAAIALRLGAESIRAAGTSALRRAADAREFVARVGRETGITIEVISGEEEARLSRAIALKELPPGSPDVVLFDVGGGSTELTWCHGAGVRAACSLELGARRCTDDAGVTQPVMPEMLARLDAIISRALAAAPGPAAGTVLNETGIAAVRLAGLGGTASEMVWLLRGQRGAPKGHPHLARVGRVELEELLRKLSGMELEQLKAQPNADPKRAEVIVAGVVIIASLLAHYGAESFTLVDRGLRFGLLLG